MLQDNNESTYLCQTPFSQTITHSTLVSYLPESTTKIAI